MKFSTTLVSTILKRLRSDYARCDGDGGKVTKGTRQIETVVKGEGRRGGGIIDLIHDTRHLCTRFRINGVKAMSRFISGGGGGGVIAVEFVYSIKTKRRLKDLENEQFEFRQVLLQHWLL